MILHTMDKLRFEITDEEGKAVAAAMADGKKSVVVAGVYLVTSSISAIYPEHKADQVERKREQTEGVLHDGTRVRKHFGSWVDADNSVPDDKGNYVPVRLDPVYYPEVARDCVPTPKEFQERFATIPTNAARLKAIVSATDPKRLGGKEKSIGEVLKNMAADNS